jgi:hypothetical protein
MEIIKKNIILFIIIILIIGGVSVFFYKKNSAKITGALNQPLIEKSNNGTVSIDKVKQEEFEQAVKKIASTDQDLDGFSDIDEAIYKTDPTSADTDGDGLSDWQEIFIYKTDPLKADTDGDAFNDGYEVRRGFSPKGKGKL